MSNFIEIKNEYLSISINTLGAELSSITGRGGTEFLWNGDKTVWSGKAPVLFPICGSLKGGKYTYNGTEYALPKHGFTRGSEFEGENLSETSARFTLKSNAETLSAYPFEFIFTITYELIEKNLKITYDVKNLSSDTMFFSIGSHEAYSCPEGIEEYYIEFEEPVTLDTLTVVDGGISTTPVRVAENITTLPLKYEYFSVDALIFKNASFDKASLVNKNTGKRCTVSFPGFNNFLIWTKPKANYLCLEPWCGALETTDADTCIENKENIVKLDKDMLFSIVHTITFEE